MNAIDMLKQDHRKVQELFRRFETAGDHAFQRKQQLAEKTFEELEHHTKLEEEIFYPAMQVAGGNGMVKEAIEEHDLVKQLIGELQAMAPDSEKYDAKFTVLAENVRQHVKEEEGEMMPHAAARLGEAELKELGGQMAERKRALTEPSFFGGTIRQAKKIVTKAFDAIANGTTTPVPTQKRRRGKKSATTRSGRGKKTTSARKVRRAIATTKRVVKSTARTATARRAARRTSRPRKAARRVGR